MQPAVDQTFQEYWRHTVATYPNNIFLVYDRPSQSWTYAQFDEIVARVAGRLRALGVGAGDPVHVVLQNSPGFVAIWLAVAQLGAWFVPVDPESSEAELRVQITRTRPKVGCYSTAREDRYQPAAAGLLEQTLALQETAADVEPGSLLLGTAHREYHPVRLLDRLAVMFTSGTTSQPKGVVLTQANYGYMARVMADAAHLTAANRVFVTLPLFHGNAQFYCFAPAIAMGASVALTSRFSASRWLSQARDLEVTHASLFAAPIRMILARKPDDERPLNLTHVWFAQNLSQEQYDTFAGCVGVLPRQLYGLTETTAVVTCDMGEEPRPMSIGTPVAGRDVILVDKVSKTVASQAEPGIITVRGRLGVEVFLEYLDDPVATAGTIVPAEYLGLPASDSAYRWLMTGDLAAPVGDGYLEFLGRIDDVIKVSGENVSLPQVEASLNNAPGVLSVAVVAANDPIRDHIPVAFIVPKSADSDPQQLVADLIEYAAEHLTPSHRPRAWQVVDELPRTSVGKVKKYRLGELGNQLALAEVADAGQAG